MSFLIFYVAIITYLVFVLILISFKIGSGAHPITQVNRLHFIFTPCFLIFSFFSIWYLGLDYNNFLYDIAIGLFLYFTLHYSIFLSFFLLAQRSVSSSLLILLSENSGQLAENECIEKYAENKGFKYIKSSRIEDLLHLGWLEQDKEKYRLTSKGKRTIMVVAFFLNLWGLRPLGK